MSYTRFLFETSVDTRSPGLNTNHCHLVSEVFKYRWLPSPGRPEEAHEATQRGMVLLPSITPSRPIPTPQVCSQRQQGVHVGRARVWTGAHGHSQSRGTQRDTGPLPAGGGDGVCCCRTWDDKSRAVGGSLRHRGALWKKILPPNQAGDRGTGEGEGVAAEGAGALPGVSGRAGGSCRVPWGPGGVGSPPLGRCLDAFPV